MKLFQNIEDLLNLLFAFARKMLKKIFETIVPKKLQKDIDKQNTKLKQRKFILDKKLTRYSDQVIAKTSELSKAAKIKALNHTSHLFKNYKSVKTYNYSALTPGKISAILAAALTPFFLKTQKWFLALKPSSIGIMLVTTSLTSISALKVYNNSQKIVDEQKEEMAAREVASIAPHRPDHYRVNERQFKVYNLALPVFFDGQKTRRPIKIDLTIETSNKYTRNYLDKNYQEVENYLNSYILPMFPNFLMEKEGKDVLKDKIRVELDKLIHERGMSGHIENVYIDSILSS